MSEYDWTGLMKTGKKNASAGLYQALINAQKANDPNAAYSALNDVSLNPSRNRITGEDAPNGIPRYTPNPYYINPKGYKYSAPANPITGGTPPVDTPVTPVDTRSQADRFKDFQSTDWWGDLEPAGKNSSGLISDAVMSAGNPLLEALKAAKARGQITDSGFTGGMTKYNKGITDATSYANSFLQGKMTEGGTALDDIVHSAGADLKAHPKDFNWDTYLGQLHSNADAFNTSLPSTLSSQLGSQSFFDIPGAMTEAGRAQGAFNPASSDSLLQALVGQTKKGGQGTLRGLGNQGAF